MERKIKFKILPLPRYLWILYWEFIHQETKENFTCHVLFNKDEYIYRNGNFLLHNTANSVPNINDGKKFAICKKNRRIFIKPRNPWTKQNGKTKDRLIAGSSAVQQGCCHTSVYIVDLLTGGSCIGAILLDTVKQTLTTNKCKIATGKQKKTMELVHNSASISLTISRVKR